ncbi:MvdD family ATP-grasp ribosomal peptide maturase [Rudanella paleaurantiibacter]|uniref:MvdD family ATP-grasp ribosomal peptide maturase n=1 Tax=Rudanella paleaurantiibacter TaxID=2614655 RepID=A0A7J5TTD9_9BACT|nr:MvdD family ATP-grasp ribosomal peptide maturase [Rudanella paleaurantiibacter]KAB7727018.1 MvdD family ATP-grasp ribosomal peptide maturase [Rudanella paleaurantiibacter]
MKTVLIITRSFDLQATTPMVVKAIEDFGGRAIVFPVDRYPFEYQLTYLDTDAGIEIWLDTPGGREAIHTCDSLWFRRFELNKKAFVEQYGAKLLPAFEAQVEATLKGLIEGFDGFVLGRPSVHRRLASREEQMRVARRAGLLVPNTCVTNSPAEARRFVQAQQPADVIVKSQASYAIQDDGQTMVMFTNRLTTDDMDALDDLQATPLMFQQAIEKEIELRITVAGHRIWAFSINSQASEISQNDWRKNGVATVSDWKPYDLPQSVAQSLHTFMDLYGLNYGAIDMIVTPQGDHYFIEINSAGEFMWLDCLQNFQISEHLAGMLLGLQPRREQGLDRQLVMPETMAY